MKQSISFGMLVATIIASLAHVGPVEACSPPLEPVEVTLPSTGTPDVIAFEVRGDLSGDLTTTLVGPDGVVTGTSERDRSSIYLFRPETPLADGTYTLTVQPANEDQVSAEVEISALGDPALDIDIAADIAERSTDRTCCPIVEDPDSYGGSCESPYSCWPSGYEYSRRLSVSVTTDRPIWVEVSAPSPLQGGYVEAPRSRGVFDSAEFSLDGGTLDAEEICVEITRTSFAGEELGSQTRCVAATDFPDVAPREVDDPDAVAKCLAPPDDESDPNWQLHGADSPAGKSSGGCNTAGASPLSPVLLLIAGLLLGRRRDQ